MSPRRSTRRSGNARTNTTVAAAYVGPVIDHYMASLEEGLDRVGISAPLMLICVQFSHPRRSRDRSRLSDRTVKMTAAATLAISLSLLESLGPKPIVMRTLRQVSTDLATGRVTSRQLIEESLRRIADPQGEGRFLRRRL